MSERLAAAYARFAETEAKGKSPLYEALARGVAADGAVLAFLMTLPPAKRQPNLLFAAVRHVCGTQPSWPDFRARLLAQEDAVRATMLVRRTQTNEPARCAVLLPMLARLPPPLALIEVGASAGLCLLPDRYGYDYGRGWIGGSPGVPVFTCRAASSVPLPDAVPRIAWRAGLDLDPIDLRDDEQVAWLETLVWPDQPDRLERLRAAIAVARRDPPQVLAGDLLRDLPALAAQRPADTTLVIFHTAVLAYVGDPAMRAAFARVVQELGAVWISNEAPGVFPAIAAKAGRPARRGFLLAVDGEPVAWSDPHGAWIDGIG